MWAVLVIVQEREAARPNRERLDGRVAECWHTLHANLDQLGTVLGTAQPPDAIIRAALAEMA